MVAECPFEKGPPPLLLVAGASDAYYILWYRMLLKRALRLLLLCSPIGLAHGTADEQGNAIRRVADILPPPGAMAAYPTGGGCPPMLDCHRMASTDGGSLFEDDPADIVLVCRYDGLRRSPAYALLPGATMCHQRVGAPLTCN